LQQCATKNAAPSELYQSETPHFWFQLLQANLEKINNFCRFLAKIKHFQSTLNLI